MMDVQEWIKEGLSPADRLVLMVEWGIPDDVLTALEVMVQDDYPWERAVPLVKGMKALEDRLGKSCVDQAKHFVKIRQVLKK